MISNTDVMRIRLGASLNKTIPTINAPDAPIPVQAAYAVPVGIDFWRINSKYPDKTIETVANTIYIILCCGETSIIFKPNGQPISQIPAISKHNHGILFSNITLFSSMYLARTTKKNS